MSIDRAKIAYDARKQGKTYKDIGGILGVGRNQAMQLTFKYQRYLKNIEEEKDPFILALLKIPGSIRTLNCLRNYGYNGSPQEIVESGPRALIKKKNFGKKSLIMIANILQEQGYIKNAELWIDQHLSSRWSGKALKYKGKMIIRPCGHGEMLVDLDNQSLPEILAEGEYDVEIKISSAEIKSAQRKINK